MSIYIYIHDPSKIPAGSFRTILFGDGRAGATDVLPLVVIATQRVSWKSKPIYKELGTSGLEDSMGSFSITHFGRIKQLQQMYGTIWRISSI